MAGRRTGSGAGRTEGFADVWLQGCFAWEYKAPAGRLDAAVAQLVRCARPLANPPLPVVSDRQRFDFHAYFTDKPSACQ